MCCAEKLSGSLPCPLACCCWCGRNAPVLEACSTPPSRTGQRGNGQPTGGSQEGRGRRHVRPAELLAQRADVETRSGDAWNGTALIETGKNGRTDIAQALLAAGANVNAADNDRWTALIVAGRDGHTATAQALLAAGAHINATNMLGSTALTLAAWSGHTATAEMLLAAGANINHKGVYGESALDEARRRGHPETAKMLEEAAKMTPQQRKEKWGKFLIEQNYFPQAAQAQNYFPQAAQAQNYSPQAAQAQNYFPQAAQGQNYFPQAAQAQNYFPQAAQAHNYSPQAAQAWACLQCTYLNGSDAAACDLCFLPKPAAALPSGVPLAAAAVGPVPSLVADSKQASSAATSLATRVQDLDLASMGLLPPIHGVMAQPLVSLAEACAGLGSLVSNLDSLVFFAAKAGKKLAKSHQQHLLTGDECGSIYLYTCESDVYRQMNRALRNKVRTAVKPWFKYLRLLFSAIGKLPAVTENVWRGLCLPDAAEAERVVKSLQEMKKDEDTLFWWGASSCTVDMATSLQFTGGKDAPYTRIMFQVRCRRGARIETLSAIGNEKEVLLLPGSSFRIKNLEEVAPKLWIVELHEETLPGNIKPVS
eukprot:g44736.t1